MPRSAAVAAIALVLQGTAYAAPPSASGLPAKVRQHVKDLNFYCSRLGGIPSNSPSLLRIVDLTGDGRADYVIDVARYQCRKAAIFGYGGHDGSPVFIYVAGVKGRAFLGYEGQSQGGTRIRAHEGRHQVWLTVGALKCGQPRGSAKSFADWWWCSRPLEWNARTNKFDLALISQARRIRG